MKVSEELSTAYLNSHGSVRARLLALGVAQADLEDVSHEVFLLLLKQRAGTQPLPQANQGLHQACDLVALAYRRKAYRRREIPSALLGEAASLSEREWKEPDEDSVSSAERLHRALAELSPAERELLALHLTAEMPFRALATIQDCDVKTVRKRVSSASERLRRLLSGRLLVDRLTPLPTAQESVPRPARASDSMNWQPLGVQSCVALSTVGNVLVSSWLGPVTQASVDFVIASGDAFARERGQRFAYYSIVEPQSPPPGFDERQRLLQIARFCKRNLSALSFVSATNNQAVAEQLLRGMSFLVRANFLLYGAKDELDGATWLVKQGYTFQGDPNLSVTVLLNALARTRQLRRKR